MDTKRRGLAVRRPLQLRDNNVAVAPSTVVIGKAPKPKPKPRAAARPLLPPPAPPLEMLRARAECAEAMTGVAEVSLAEELERARERRGRLRAAREVTQRDLDGRAAALDREAEIWEHRTEEQGRLVAELMRLIGMPEVYTPVESLRCREERKRREAVALARSASRGSTSAASPLQGAILERILVAGNLEQACRQQILRK
ncbi:hypothetical protein QOZ80_5BG0424770 [Eleusine coracana subsp. coracana]|nr:hypothetical protein QOZ80_5BG0424770 [Eleusine coracana subsp. coracana]